MVRKSTKSAKTPVPAYVNLTSENVGAIVLATSGSIKDKQVDPRKIVGTIHIKKYLADAKINGKVETWISIVKKLTAPLEEGETREELTADEVEALEQCRVETAAYLESEASPALKTKVAESTDELKNLKDISSSMKYKFSHFAYETVTHVINLMVRELLVFTCNNCAAQKAKLTKVDHVPWRDIQTQMLSGLYTNTKVAFEATHPTLITVDEPVVEETEEEESSEETTTEEETVAAPVEKAPKPRLSQFISNTFKEIVSREERFTGLLLGKGVTALINEIIYQVLDRYANVIKSLLQTADSKTVNERIAVIATKILLQDHIHSSDEDVSVVLDVVQVRLDELRADAAAAKLAKEETTPAETS